MSNSPPNFNNNNWNPEEIPGYTTFLYKENRFREEDEYIYSWKEEKALANQLPLLNNQKLDKLTLLENLLTTQEEIHKLTTELSLIESLNHNLVTERERMQITLNKKEKDMYLMGSHVHDLTQKCDSLLDKIQEMQKFLDHTSDCSYFESLNTCRQINPNTCSCGLFQKQEFWKK